MSTPHFGLDLNESYKKVTSILKATNKIQSKFAEAQLPKEAAVLTDLSVRFEAVRILIPMLSMYEQVATKFRDGHWLKHKSLIVSSF